MVGNGPVPLTDTVAENVVELPKTVGLVDEPSESVVEITAMGSQPRGV
jgi:hypothetical protein